MGIPAAEATHLREVYPRLGPKLDAKLVDIANRDADASHALIEQIGAASYIGDVEKAYIVDAVCHARETVDDSALHGLRGYQALQAAASPGTPFLERSIMDHDYYAGRFGEELTVITGRGAARNPAIPSKVDIILPSFHVDPVEAGNTTFPDVLVTETVHRQTLMEWGSFGRDNLECAHEILAGNTRLSIGGDAIQAQLHEISLEQEHDSDRRRQLTRRELFYAAYALRLAGVSVDVDLHETVIQDVGGAVVETLIYSAAAAVAPDREVRGAYLHNEAFGSDVVLEKTRRNSLQLQPISHIRAMLATVGLSEVDVLNLTYKQIEVMRHGAASTPYEIGVAERAVQPVTRLITNMYAAAR